MGDIGETEEVWEIMPLEEPKTVPETTPEPETVPEPQKLPA